MVEIGYLAFKPAHQIVRCDGCGVQLAKYTLDDIIPEFEWLTFTMAQKRMDFCTPDNCKPGMETRTCARAILARARKWEKTF